MTTKQAITFILIFLTTIVSLHAQKATVINTDSEKEFIPEGIAIDKKSGIIYISSIDKHKIIKVDKKGKTTDFIKKDQDGFLEGLGMKIDEKRNWLWALSVLHEGKTFHSKIHAFDLKSGRTMQQYGIKDTVPHLFNDLAISDNGIFISDTYFSAIYKLDPVARKLDLYLQSRQLSYPNGLVFGNNHLYIATYKNGLVRMDTASKEIVKLAGVTDTTFSYSLDGLLFHNNTLIGVANSFANPSLNGVIQYSLSENGTAVTTSKILGQKDAPFEIPTTAAIFKDKLYVIANSHLDVFNANKTSTKGIEDKLKPVTLIVYDLK